MKITKEIDTDGNIRYYNEQGQFHREDGPAIEYASGTKYWYLNGLVHREDGPAVEYTDGHKAWYLNDKRYSEQEFNDFLLKKRLKRILEL
jgi:hypothetical protein